MGSTRLVRALFVVLVCSVIWLLANFHLQDYGLKFAEPFSDLPTNLSTFESLIGLVEPNTNLVNNSIRLSLVELPPDHATPFNLSRSEAGWTTNATSRTMLAYPVETWRPNQNDAWVLRDLGLKVYVYDTSTWPEGMSSVVHCRLGNHLNASKEQWPSNDNRITDIGLIQLFETYPGRVYDPDQADVFVVPYPHASHCLSDCRPGNYGLKCSGVPQSWIHDLIDQRLTYFRGDDIDRHLFLLTAPHMLNLQLQMAALKFVHGGRIYKVDAESRRHLARMNPRYTEEQLGNFITPYMNTHPWMQPSVVLSRPPEWWTRPRKYSFVYLFGASNKKTKAKPRVHRKLFQNHLEQAYPDGILGGLPYILGLPKAQSPEVMMRLYQESTFCPCLPGDTVTQKRFYDVILSGCIPVMLKFPQQSLNGTVITWHPFENSLLENTYPFMHPEQYAADERLDYQSFVVEVDLPANEGNLESAMEELLKPEQADELRRRQVALSRVAPFLTYGLGPENAHVHEDAFAKLLRALKRRMDTKLPARQRAGDLNQDRDNLVQQHQSTSEVFTF